MAGRKQHYIQQLLLRGFAIDPARRPAQVWVYRKGQAPFVCATENYGAQRDFYGSPEDTTVDDGITEAEGTRFNKFIEAARQCDDGSEVDACEAASYYQHLLFRSKNTRDVFASGVGQLLAHMGKGLLDKDILTRHLTELFLRHPEQLVAKAEQEIGRRFSSTERDLIVSLLKQDIPRLVPLFLDQAWPSLEAQFASFLRRVPEMAAQGHQSALRKSLGGEVGKREKEMQRMRWHVHEVGSPLVLGDSCVFAELCTGRFLPMSDNAGEVANLFLPVSSTRYLVGNATGERARIGVKQLKLAAITCSYESFCTCEESAELRTWMVQIGESAMQLTSDELHRIAADGLHQVLAEQLVRGMA